MEGEREEGEGCRVRGEGYLESCRKFCAALPQSIEYIHRTTDRSEVKGKVNVKAKAKVKATLQFLSHLVWSDSILPILGSKMIVLCPR